MKSPLWILPERRVQFQRAAVKAPIGIGALQELAHFAKGLTVPGPHPSRNSSWPETLPKPGSAAIQNKPPSGSDNFFTPRTGTPVGQPINNVPLKFNGVVSSKGSHAGFSLVELLCAILILGVGMVGLTRGIATSLVANKESEYQTSAAFLAAGIMDSLKADGMFLEGEEEGAYSGGLSMYGWKTSVLESDIEGLYEVTVTITQESSGKSLFVLQTLMFDPPLDLGLEMEETDPREEEAGRGNQGMRRRP